MCYLIEVIYKPRPENKAAGAFSSRDNVGDLNALSVSPYWPDFPKLREELFLIQI